MGLLQPREDIEKTVEGVFLLEKMLLESQKDDSSFAGFYPDYFSQDICVIPCCVEETCSTILFSFEKEKTYIINYAPP